MTAEQTGPLGFLANFDDDDQHAQNLIDQFHEADGGEKVRVAIGFVLKHTNTTTLQEKPFETTTQGLALLVALADHLKAEYTVAHVLVQTSDRFAARVAVLDTQDILYVNFLAEPVEDMTAEEQRRSKFRDEG